MPSRKQFSLLVPLSPVLFTHTVISVLVGFTSSLSLMAWKKLFFFFILMCHFPFLTLRRYGESKVRDCAIVVLHCFSSFFPVFIPTESLCLMYKWSMMLSTAFSYSLFVSSNNNLNFPSCRISAAWLQRCVSDLFLLYLSFFLIRCFFFLPLP